MTTASASAAPIAARRSPPSQDTLRVLVAEKFETVGVEGLKNLGCDVRMDTTLTPDTLADAVAEFDPNVLIVRGMKVQAPVFDKGKSLSLVLRAGAGYDTIDVSAASAKGIFVANCPGKNAIAVAELTWALILSCDRRVPDQTIDLRNGVWNKKEYSKAAGLYGRTLGIVGLGQIGKEVAARGRAFGMKVVAWSRSLTEDQADGMDIHRCENLVNLAKMSDVISVNVAATADTKHLINEQFCNALKPGAYFVNTSRGSVVDEQALTNAIRTKNIRCGLDVFAAEPGGNDTNFTDAIVKEKGVYGTHHVGASTDQAQNAIAREAVRVVAEYIASGRVLNCVNRAASTPATCLLTVRHVNKPGVLAHVFYTLGQAGINVEEMENVIYDGAKAACARIQLDSPPTAEHLRSIGSNEHVLSVSMANIHS
jgi:D-3-phosphoglycerate dehydrogenase / 2-oxoglutarate reductase